MSYPELPQHVADYLTDQAGAAEILAANLGAVIWRRALDLGIEPGSARPLSLRCLTAILLALKNREHLREGKPPEVWFRIQVRELLVAYWAEEQLLGTTLNDALRLHQTVDSALAALPPIPRRVLSSRPDGSVASYVALSVRLGLSPAATRRAHELGLQYLRGRLAADPSLRLLLNRLRASGKNLHVAKADASL